MLADRKQDQHGLTGAKLRGIVRSALLRRAQRGGKGRVGGGKRCLGHLVFGQRSALPGRLGIALGTQFGEKALAPRLLCLHIAGARIIAQHLQKARVDMGDARPDVVERGARREQRLLRRTQRCAGLRGQQLA
ncbi:hypothetical protein [Accumulibacter sp.]|uniref:hypothetical protein n=1 Tax=Accumulibacter sp. TaxID=2053492 RepID=UPI002878E081|nr:hypothetical protein [Accumulibacter sp.]MDS4056364.1 hypothetical protein [Accumulibacter sp.]